MSKTAKDLALAFTPAELTEIHNNLTKLSRFPLWIAPILKEIQEAIKLSVDSIIYLFHTYDSITEQNLWNSEWVSIYKKVENDVEKINNENDLPEIEDVIKILKEMLVNVIITWNINDKFLWIERKYTHNNNDEWEDNPNCYDVISNDPLEEYEIEALKEAWINVLFIDELKE